MWPCIVTNFFIIKPTRCTNFPNSLQHETLHVSGSFSAHHQEFFHCKFSNVMQVCRQLSSRTRSCSKAVYKSVWHIPVPSVRWVNSWWWAEELPETCRVSCRSEFGKLVHLVGFIIKKCIFIFKILTAPLLKIVFLWDMYAVSTGKQLLTSRKIIMS